MAQTFSNSGTFDGLDATLQLTLPNAADDDFSADIQLSQSGIEPTINLAFAIDRSGSSADDTGIDFNNDGETDTFLEAQVYAAGLKIGQLLAAGYEPDAVNITIVDYGNDANSFTANLGTNSADLFNYIDGLTSGGTTNYAAALSEVENAWDAQGVGTDESNFLYFYSDGFPVPSGQDYVSPLASLNAAYDPQVTAVGFGPNSAEDDLDVIDGGGDAAIVTNDAELLALLNTPPPLPEIDSFSVSVDGVLIETIDISDPRVVVNATGFTIADLDVTGYATTPGAPQTIDVQVVANLTNGDTLDVSGPIPIVDGVVEGTAGDDLIDLAYDGDPEGDSIDAGDNIDPTATGAALDNDLVEAGDGDDTVLGLNGDDTLFGQEGDDSLVGGVGDDQLGGAEGDDTLEGGDGDDSLTGGSGDDNLDGGAGDDTINGNSGNDEVVDTEGDNLVLTGNVDTVTGISDGLPDAGVPFVPGLVDPDPNDDADTVTLGAGDDTVFTGDDNDVVDAGDGDNVVDTGLDDDSVTTGSGDDLITGGEGDDTISSGAGDDTIFGGINNPSADIPDDGSDPTFPGADPNPGNSPLSNGDDFIDAGAGNDVVLGEDDNDTILGGTGDDSLDGGIDNDVIDGGDGDDTVIGGQGDDELTGGDGGDSIVGGTGSDSIDLSGATTPDDGSVDIATGGDDEDSFVNAGIGDTVIGGEGGVDDDSLDLTGLINFEVDYNELDPTFDPATGTSESGVVNIFTDSTESTIAGQITFAEIENVIPCFTPGAMIATPTGEVPVETLREGDKVITRDNGIQEIRWVGRRTLNREELGRAPNLKPILIRAGALGYGLPERDMVVSPQHRLLIAGDQTQLYFEESEVLVAAKHLEGHDGIQKLDTLRTTYIHFMFDRHEVVLSDGAWTESFQPGEQTLGAMGDEVRAEIVTLFPELAESEGIADYAAARRALKAHEAKLLQL